VKLGKRWEKKKSGRQREDKRTGKGKYISK
jgi:hypothetical protein